MSRHSTLEKGRKYIEANKSFYEWKNVWKNPVTNLVFPRRQPNEWTPDICLNDRYPIIWHIPTILTSPYSSRILLLSVFWVGVIVYLHYPIVQHLCILANICVYLVVQLRSTFMFISSLFILWFELNSLINIFLFFGYWTLHWRSWLYLVSINQPFLRQWLSSLDYVVHKFELFFPV